MGGLISPSEVDFTVGYTMSVDPEKHEVIEGVGGGTITQELAVTSLALIAPFHRQPYLRALLKKVFDLLPKDVLQLINRMIQPVALQTDTHSRGYVFATSTDIEDLPSVTANYYQDPRDWASQRERFSKLLELSQTEALANYSYHRVPFPSVFYELMLKHVPELAKAVACFARDEKDDVYKQLMFPCAPVPYDSEAARDLSPGLCHILLPLLWNRQRGGRCRPRELRRQRHARFVRRRRLGHPVPDHGEPTGHHHGARALRGGAACGEGEVGRRRTDGEERE